MPGKRTHATSSNDPSAPRAKRSTRARPLSPHERSDSSSDEEGGRNERGVGDISPPATIPPLEATTSQLPTGEGAAMVLQAVHLIKGLNAEEIAILRANRQQFAAYNRARDFPLH